MYTTHVKNYLNFAVFQVDIPIGWRDLYFLFLTRSSRSRQKSGQSQRKNLQIQWVTPGSLFAVCQRLIDLEATVVGLIYYMQYDLDLISFAPMPILWLRIVGYTGGMQIYLGQGIEHVHLSLSKTISFWSVFRLTFFHFHGVTLISQGQSTEAVTSQTFFIDLKVKATVGTYELRSYGGGEQQDRQGVP